MTRREIKANAREQMKGKFWILAAITALYYMITHAVGMIPPVWTETLADGTTSTTTLGTYIMLFLVPAFGISMAAIYLGVTRGRKPEIADLFQGFKIYGKALWLWILVGFFTLVWSLGAIIGLLITASAIVKLELFGGSGSGVIIGIVMIIAGLIPGVVKGLSYSQSFFILADNPSMTAREALSNSKEITNRKKSDLFILGLSFIGWILLSIAVMVFVTIMGLESSLVAGTIDLLGLLAVLLLIPVVIYMGVAFANFYVELSTGSGDNEVPGPVEQATVAETVAEPKAVVESKSVADSKEIEEPETNDNTEVEEKVEVEETPKSEEPKVEETKTQDEQKDEDGPKTE